MEHRDAGDLLVSNLLQYTLEWFQTLDRVACLNLNSLGPQWQEHLAVDIFQSLCLPTSRKDVARKLCWNEAMVLREVRIVANASTENMMGSMKLSMFQTTISGVTPRGQGASSRGSLWLFSFRSTFSCHAFLSLNPHLLPFLALP